MFKRAAVVAAAMIMAFGVVGSATVPVQTEEHPPTFALHVDVVTPTTSGEESQIPRNSWVSVYSMNGAGVSSFENTDVSELPAGRYLVKVASSEPYADVWFGDTSYRSRAQPVEIIDRDVSVTVTMGYDGTLAGSVTDSQGRPIVGGSAAAFLHDPTDDSYELAGTAMTDPSGAYSMSVAPGSYVIRGAQQPINAGYVIPEYGDRLVDDGATVDVSELESIGGLDVALPPWTSTTARIAGPDRFATSVQASQAAFAPGVPVVYVTNGMNWPDALSAGPAAAHDGGPLLVTETSSIPAVIGAELRRLQPQRIVVVGGPKAVSDDVLAQLRTYSPTVTRIGGADRFEVSRAVSSTVFGVEVPSRTMLVATGANFPDALAAGAVAARSDAPVVLLNTGSSTIDDTTRLFLFKAGLTELTAVGGPSVISNDYLSQLDYFTKWGEAGRYDGADRFAVNRALNGGGGGAYPTVEWQQTAYLVSARNYPDAMSATTLAASQKAKVFLSEPTCVPQETLDLMRGSHIDNVVLVGGQAALSDAVARLQPC